MAQDLESGRGGYIFLRGCDDRCFLQTFMHESQTAEGKCSLLSVDRGSAGRGLSPLHAMQALNQSDQSAGQDSEAFREESRQARKACGTRTRVGAEQIYRTTAFQASDGRESIGLSAGASRSEPARRSEKRR